MQMDVISEGTGGDSSGDLLAKANGINEDSQKPKAMPRRVPGRKDDSNSTTHHLAEC
jgi:hypothetical protein